MYRRGRLYAQESSVQAGMRTRPTQGIGGHIVTVRGQKVILDSDLARIYGVDTKALNQAVKRNIDKFPSDIMFQLTPQKHRDPRFLPNAFTV